MTRIPTLLAASALVSLAACAEPVDRTSIDEIDAEVAAVDTEGDALDAALDTGDFMALELGAKIVGPQGEEVKATLDTADGSLADITSYVACPAGMEACDPAAAPEGTIYTYVHTISPSGNDGDGDDDGNENESDEDSASDEVAEAPPSIAAVSSFAMLLPAHGFTGAAGYSKAPVAEAIGDTATVAVTCLDGALIWEVNPGESGGQWEAGEAITFYWQSTLPPAGPSEAYAIRAGDDQAKGSGPYPGEAEGVANACMPLAQSG